MTAIGTLEMEEILRLLKFVEASDFEPFKYVSVGSGIPVVDSEDETRVLGHLVAVDGGIWQFEPKGDD